MSLIDGSLFPIIDDLSIERTCLLCKDRIPKISTKSTHT